MTNERWNKLAKAAEQAEVDAEELAYTLDSALHLDPEDIASEANLEKFMTEARERVNNILTIIDNALNTPRD